MIIEAFAGARQTPREITWNNSDGTPGYTNSATLTGVLYDRELRTTKPIDGVLEKTAVDGVFRWSFGVTDVQIPGTYDVQFIATYAGGKFDASMLAVFVVLTRI